MASHRLIPLILLTVAAGCSGDATGPAVGPNTTTTSAMAASAPLLSAKVDGAVLGSGCESVVGTFFGEHMKPPAVPAKGWYGTLYVSIAGGTVVMPGFFDRGVAGTHRAHGSRGMFSGKETNTITFSPGNTFDIDASYNAQPTGTPGLFVLHETGSLTNGSGDFAGVSGHVAVDGPFTFPPDGANPHWIAQMHGSICGLQ